MVQSRATLAVNRAAEAENMHTISDDPAPRMTGAVDRRKCTPACELFRYGLSARTGRGGRTSL
jgi:hypothetical protein